MTYSYFADPMYVFMDNEFNQFDVEKENMGDALNYLEDGLACELTFYEGRAISVELPNTVVREVTYTEPAVKGDTSGKVIKPAKLAHRLRGRGAAVRQHRRQDRGRHAHRRVQAPHVAVSATRRRSQALVVDPRPLKAEPTKRRRYFAGPGTGITSLPSASPTNTVLVDIELPLDPDDARLITSFFTGTSVRRYDLPPGPGIVDAAFFLSSAVSGSSAIEDTFAPMPSVIIIR